MDNDEMYQQEKVNHRQWPRLLSEGGWTGSLLRGGVGTMGDEALSGPFCCSLDDLHFVGNQCSLLLTRVRSLFDSNIVISAWAQELSGRNRGL